MLYENRIVDETGKELLTAIVAGYETALRVRGIQSVPMLDCYGGTMDTNRLPCRRLLITKSSSREAAGGYK